MDVPSSSDNFLSAFSKDSHSVKIHGQCRDLPNKKRKRSLSKENDENIEEGPKEKNARKSRSKKYTHLPVEAAEEKRRRVNEQERRRQKQIAEAIERLRSLNMPFNPNLPNYKKDSTMYTICTATELIIALRKKLEEHGIAEPEQLEILPQQPVSKQHGILQQPASKNHGAENGNNGVQNVPIKILQSSALVSATGPTHFVGDDNDVSVGETSRNYQSSCYNVTHPSNKLVDVNDRQQYPYGDGNIYPQNNKMNQVNQQNITQPQVYAVPPGQGHYPVEQRFMTPYMVGSCGTYNGPVPMQLNTSRPSNVYYRHYGPNDVTNQFSNSLLDSSTPTVSETLVSKTYRHLGHSQEHLVCDTSLPLVTMPFESTTTPSSNINQHDGGNFNGDFVSCCGNGSLTQAFMDDFINSWTD